MKPEDLDAVVLKALRRTEDSDAVAVIVGLVSLLCMIAVLEVCLMDWRESAPQSIEAIEKDGER